MNVTRCQQIVSRRLSMDEKWKISTFLLVVLHIDWDNPNWCDCSWIVYRQR